MNKAFRAAAGDPALIDFAVNNNPNSYPQMRPLYGIAGQFPLSDSDESDLAAYINSVVYPPAAGAKFASNPPSWNFGAIAAGTQSGTTTFTISNSGSSGSVNSVSSSNNTEFLVAGGTCITVPHTVAQSGNCTVQVRFAPSVSGNRNSTLTILNSGTPNPVTIALGGTGTASAPVQANLSVSPSATFGSQPLFVQSTAKALTVRNIGTASASIYSVSSSNANEFPITSNTCSGALAAGGTCTVNVAFYPTTAGARSGTLTVSSDAVNGAPSIALSGIGASTGSGGGGTKVSVVEFYNAGFNHYFITASADDITYIAQHLPDWQPTGLTFNAYAITNPPAGSVAICRFFNDHFNGISTHFYAPHGFGCEQTVTSFPDWTLENPQAFFANIPDGAGNCAAGQIPLYRVYNNGMGGAPNHRFTTSLAVRQTMIDKGYTPEGNGIGVAMCVPQ
ncbi:MAG: choice-of-anchor D domain-containing protein [Casimicrobiaceae bacterium]